MSASTVPATTAAEERAALYAERLAIGRRQYEDDLRLREIEVRLDALVEEGRDG